MVSDVLPFVLASAYVIPTYEIHQSFMVSQRMDLFPVRLTISLIALGTKMFYNDKKRFESFIHLAPSKFSEAIGEDAMSF